MSSISIVFVSSTLHKCVRPRESGFQNFLGPQADACFGATPVPNVGKSSALLMSGAWNRYERISFCIILR